MYNSFLTYGTGIDIVMSLSSNSLSCSSYSIVTSHSSSFWFGQQLTKNSKRQQYNYEKYYKILQKKISLMYDCYFENCRKPTQLIFGYLDHFKNIV